MRIWVDIEDANRNKLGDGPLASVVRATLRDRLNQAGAYEFELPATDPRSDLIQPRRTALIYGMVSDTPTFLGGGPIDETRVRIRDDGVSMLVVKGGDLLRELARVTVGDLTLTSTGDDNLDDIVDVAVTELSWQHTGLGSSPDWQGHLVYENVLNSLVEMMDKIGGYFRRETQLGEIRNITTFFATASSGILATTHGDPDAIRANANACLITDIEVVEESYDLKNRVYLWGAGEGESRLTIAAATQWPDGTAIGTTESIDGESYQSSLANNYIQNATSVSAYGVDEVALSFPDITPLTNSDADLEAAANFLVLAGVEYLRKHRSPYASYRLRVMGLDGLLQPGQTLRVEARRFRDGEKPINIAEDLVILEVETRVDELGVRTAELICANVARWPESDGAYVARELARSRVSNAHPQMGPSVDTISYREHVDDTHDATLYFWLGEETTTVASVLVRVHTAALRSTSKTVGGTITGTVDLPEHDHGVTVYGVADPSSNPLARIVYMEADTNLFTAAFGSGADEVATTSEDGDATVSLDLTNALELEYGIYDAASWYQPTDLEYSVNGGAWAAIGAGQAISGASGWYGLDITAALIDADTKRPAAMVNSIAFRVASASETGSHAQITVQIERRTTIQSISVF